ncbi:helix-turn-helix transcriptional regulator [Moritella sp. 24]|nr:helix-turn-helix transcriptional regulator [Moritella sp. 24]
MELDNDTTHFDSDRYIEKVNALRTTGLERDHEMPVHQHVKCQLVMPLSGYVRCTIADAIWMVPANCAVWIPSQVPHSNHISICDDVCMLFVDPSVLGIPDKISTLSVSPLLRELIISLASKNQHYASDESAVRLAQVLIDELICMPKEHFDFPIPVEPRLNKIANQLLDNPADRKTVGEWASLLAMSERTFSRLVKQETGMTFGRWRGQLHLVMALQKLSSNESVQRVSEDLGYESVSAFITFFKKTLGRPPKQYMKQSRD